MAATTLTACPSEVYAGDTLLFTQSFPDYPASDGWAVTFTFRAKDAADVSFTSSAAPSDSSLHFVSLAPAATAVWVAADYQGVAKATLSGQSFTCWKGSLRVNTDLAQQDANFDTRSHAKKCLDAIEAVMEGKATRDILNTTVAGQSVGRLTPDQLIAFRSYYAAEVAAENAALGNLKDKNILAIFNRP